MKIYFRPSLAWPPALRTHAHSSQRADRICNEIFHGSLIGLRIEWANLFQKSWGWRAVGSADAQPPEAVSPEYCNTTPLNRIGSLEPASTSPIGTCSRCDSFTSSALRTEMATKHSGEVSDQWNWVNVSHPGELKHAANITTIRRRAMLDVHRVKRCKRGRRTTQSKIAATTLVRTWEKTDDSDKGASPHIVEDGKSSSRSVLDVHTGIDVRLCYTAHLDYPEQSYLLNHC